MMLMVLTMCAPLPFDHFFFCFLPAAAAAGACNAERCQHGVSSLLCTKDLTMLA